MKKLKLKAFSLLELLISISIIGVLSLIILPKIITNKKDIDFIKLKTDVGLIRLAIASIDYSKTLNDKKENLDFKLDDAISNQEKEKLFTNILQYPISAKNKINSWMKVSNNKYKYKLSKDVFLNFIYDNKNNTFNCDYSNEYCDKINH